MKFNSYFIYDVLKQNPKAMQCNAMQSVHCCVRKKSNFWMELLGLENEKEGARSMRWDEMGGDALICSSRFDICPSHYSSYPHILSLSLSYLFLFIYLFIFFLSNTSVYLYIYLLSTPFLALSSFMFEFEVELQRPHPHQYKFIIKKKDFILRCYFLMVSKPFLCIFFVSSFFYSFNGFHYVKKSM